MTIIAQVDWIDCIEYLMLYVARSTRNAIAFAASIADFTGQIDAVQKQNCWRIIASNAPIKEAPEMHVACSFGTALPPLAH